MYRTSVPAPLALVLASLTTGLCLTSVRAQMLTTLHSFTYDAGIYKDGATPYTGLIQAKDGNLYGTTSMGGSFDGGGTIFQIRPNPKGQFVSGGLFVGKLNPIYPFRYDLNAESYPDGSQPNALIQASDGILYGTTPGTVFGVTTFGSLDTLHVFDANLNQDRDGSDALAGLVQARDDSLYGTTAAGGDNQNGSDSAGSGTVFTITTGGVLTPLHVFNDAEGINPAAALVQASDGNLYGTTSHFGLLPNGSVFGNGSVFQITPTGDLTTLHVFGSVAGDGANPTTGLIQATDGNLYGTTSSTVFQIQPGPGGQFVAAGAFIGTFNIMLASPWSGLNSLIQGRDGYLYATTSSGGTGSGTIVRIRPDSNGQFISQGAFSGVFETLYTFSALSTTAPYGNADGAYPYGTLVQDSQGDLYGTCSGGGASGNGTVFRFAPIMHGIDISYPAGPVSGSSWNKLLGRNSTLSWNKVANTWNFAVVGLFGGVTQNIYASQQLAGARAAGIPTAAFILLNFTHKPDPKTGVWSGAWQVSKAAQCIDADNSNIAFAALDVEPNIGTATNFIDQQTTRAIITDAYNVITAAGVPVVIYTINDPRPNVHGWSWLTGWTQGTDPSQQSYNPYHNLPLWDTQIKNPKLGTTPDYDSLTHDWDDLLNPPVHTAYGGWNARQGRQFEFDGGQDTALLQSQTGIKSIDMDVMDFTLFPAVQPVLLPVITIAPPAEVIGGATAKASVELCGPNAFGGVTVGLSSSDPTVAWPVDAAGRPITSVTIQDTTTGGTFNAPFSVRTAPVAYNPDNPGGTTLAFISGTLFGQTASSAIRLLPPYLKSFTLSPNPLKQSTMGRSTQGAITLNGAAAVDLTIKLTVVSAAGAIAAIPASVVIPANQSSVKNWSISTKPVKAQTRVTIAAQITGPDAYGTTLQVVLTINP